MSDFSNIEKFSGNRNMGGVYRKFRFLPVEEVSEIPFYEEDNIENEITLADGSGWFEAWASFETLGFREKPIGEAGNLTGYEVELPGMFAKDTPGLLTKVQRMEGRRFFILAEDHNGNVCLLGNQQKDKDGVYKGIRFQSVRDTGSKVAEKNGYAFTFKGAQPVRSPFYQNTIVEAPLDCHAATATFVDENGDPIAALPDVEIISGGSEEVVIPNVAWTDSDLSSESTLYGQAIVCTPQVKTVDIVFTPIAIGDDTSGEFVNATGVTITITALTDNNANSGTLTVSEDGVTFSTFSPPRSIPNGDSLYVRRTTTTGVGKITASGTHA